MLKKCLALWITCLASGTTASVVSFIKPCKPLDSKCIVNSAEIALPHVVKGIKEIGLPPLDPLPIKDVKADSGGLKLSLTDIIIYNLSKSKIISITRDPEKSTCSIIIECPLVIKGKYKMDGNLLNIQVYGEDKFEIGGGILRASADLKIKTFNKDGEKYYKVSGFDYSYEPMTMFDINFNNLYDGDKAKAEPILAVMKQSWKSLILDFGNPVIKEGMTSIVNNVDKLIQHMAAKDLEIA